MRARRLRWTVMAVVLVGVGALVQACSTSSSSGAAGCDGDPNQCGAGTTCWAKDCTCAAGVSCGSANCTPHLACLPSVSGKKPHDSCANTIGQPTCSDHQTCVELQSGFGGCLQFCDDSKPNRGCPTIETCVDLRAGGTADSPVLHVCAVVEADAGAGGDSGTVTDTGTPIRDAKSELPI